MNKYLVTRSVKARGTQTFSVGKTIDCSTFKKGT